MLYSTLNASPDWGLHYFANQAATYNLHKEWPLLPQSTELLKLHKTTWALDFLDQITNKLLMNSEY